MGHTVTAAVRRPDEFPLHEDGLTVVRAHVADESSFEPVIGVAEGILSTLVKTYSQQEIHLYSVATQAIVDAAWP